MDAKALLQRLGGRLSRGELKDLAERVEADPRLREALIEAARARGLVEPGETLSGKQLLRRLRERAEAAQERRSPVHRDEGFTCMACGAQVPPGGARVRDHCPRCLHGRHLDRIPGDRAAGCGGLLVPVELELRGEQPRIHHRCARCGHRHRVRAHPEDDLLSFQRALAPQPPPRPRGQTLALRVLERIRRVPLWAPGAEVLLAVSGGLDSSVLLDVLARTAGAHGARLRVASVDHGLRPEAAAEVEAVGRLCAARGLPFHPLRLELERGPDLARRAREARRSALLSLGIGRVATGHHRDDQAETVLQRLMAGAGAAGLSAMAELDPPWCRPLLGFDRAELLEYAELNRISWVDDPSNSGSERGALRGLLLGLGEARAGAVRGLGRSAALLAEDEALLQALLDERWEGLVRGEGLDLVGLTALPVPLRRRALRRLCGRRGRVPRADQLEPFLGDPPPEGREVELAGGGRLVVREGIVRIE